MLVVVVVLVMLMLMLMLVMLPLRLRIARQYGPGIRDQPEHGGPRAGLPGMSVTDRLAAARQEATSMRGQATGRVIVGVDDSLAGLQALREAAGLARRLGMKLLALRACGPRLAGADFSCWPDAGPDPVFTRPAPRDLCQQLARSLVDHAFSEAMGGMPADVPVDTLIAYGRPYRELTAAVRRDADLLVVGASRHRPWRPFRRSVGRYCAAHAGCPVLIVPPHEAARELDRTWRSRRWLKKRRESSTLLAGVSS